MIHWKSAQPWHVIHFILFVTILANSRFVCSDEIGVDSQTLFHPLSAANSTENVSTTNITSESPQGSSNKFVPLRPSLSQQNRFLLPRRPGQFANNRLHEHRPYSHHHQHSPHFYRPLIPLDPSQMDHLSNANKLIIGEFVNGLGNAFHNFVSQRIERHSVGPVRLLDQFQLTASQLLPSASKLMARTGKDEAEKRNVATSESKSESKVDPTVAYPNGEQAINYEAEGEKLRHNIVSKVGHLQTVLTTAIEVSKERRDLISRRILEQTNFRLEQAKERADRILSEVRRPVNRSAKPTNLFVLLSFPYQPQNSQIVVRALHTINDGINSIHSFLHGLLDRINTNINYKLPDQGHKIEEEKADASKQSAIPEEPKKNTETSQNKEKAPEESKQ